MAVLRSSGFLNVFEHAPCIILIFFVACDAVQYKHRLNSLGPLASMSANFENHRSLEAAYLNI